MTDSNQNITKKFDLKRKNLKLKIDFDSSLTCYNLDPKSIFVLREFNLIRFIFKLDYKQQLIYEITKHQTFNSEIIFINLRKTR
jgi:hypothetical protein